MSQIVLHGVLACRVGGLGRPAVAVALDHLLDGHSLYCGRDLFICRDSLRLLAGYPVENVVAAPWNYSVMVRIVPR